MADEPKGEPQQPAQPDPLASLRTTAAALELRERAIAGEIGNWSVLNANHMHHVLTAKAMGLDPTKSIIPYGSNTTYVNQTADGEGAARPTPSATSSLATKAAVGALSLLGAGGGAAGLAALLGLIGPGAVPPEDPSAYEWVLDVERNYEFGGAIGGGTATANDRTDAGGHAGQAESGAGIVAQELHDGTAADPNGPR